MSVGYGDGGQQRPTQQSQRGGVDAGPEDWQAIREDVNEIAGAAVEHGRQFFDSAREQATTFVDKRKDDAAQSISDIAQSLRDACAQFDDRPNIRTFVDSAADGLDQFADSIRARSFNELFDNVETMVRQRPATVAAATMVAGFLVARFIKASAENIRDSEANRRRSAGGQGPRAKSQGRAQASAGSSYARSGA